MCPVCIRCTTNPKRKLLRLRQLLRLPPVPPLLAPPHSFSSSPFLLSSSYPLITLTLNFFSWFLVSCWCDLGAVWIWISNCQLVIMMSYACALTHVNQNYSGRLPFSAGIILLHFFLHNSWSTRNVSTHPSLTFENKWCIYPFFIHFGAQVVYLFSS